MLSKRRKHLCQSPPAPGVPDDCRNRTELVSLVLPPWPVLTVREAGTARQSTSNRAPPSSPPGRSDLESSFDGSQVAMSSTHRSKELHRDRHRRPFVRDLSRERSCSNMSLAMAQSESLTFGFNALHSSCRRQTPGSADATGLREKPVSSRSATLVETPCPVKQSARSCSRRLLRTALGWHQQHRCERVGALFQRRRRPRAAGDGEALPCAPIEQKMTEFVSEREAAPPRVGVEVIVTVPDEFHFDDEGLQSPHPRIDRYRTDSASATSTARPSSIASTSTGSPSTQASRLIVQLFRECVSLLPRRVGRIAYRRRLDIGDAIGSEGRHLGKSAGSGTRRAP